MKTTCLLSLLIILTTHLHAQNPRTRFSIGPEFCLPTFQRMPGNGIGISGTIEFKSKHKVSALIHAGYDHFNGDVINEFNADTVHGFGFVPIIAGARFSFANKFYATVSAGLTFGTDDFQKHFTFSPAAGIVLPNTQHPKFDLGIRWLGMPGVPSIPENTFLDKGGFSYLNFRAAIIF